MTGGLRIDAASGEVRLDAVDAVVPGPIPLVLSRSYRSRRTASGAFGRGWSWSLDLALVVDGGAVRCEGGAFDGAAFALPEPGRAARLDSGLVLERHPDALALWTAPGRRLLFDLRGRVGDRIPLSGIRDGSGGSLAFERRGGRVVRIEGPPAGALRVEHGPDGAEAVVQGRGEPLARWAYAGGALGAAVAGGRASERFAYDAGRLVEHRVGRSTTYTQYDAEGRGLALWGSAWPGVRVAYDPLRHTTRVLEADGGQTLFRHAVGVQVLEAVHPDATARVFYYDALGRFVGHGDEQGPAAFQALDGDTLLAVAGGARGAAVAYDDHGRAVSVSALGEDAAYALRWSDAHALVGVRTPGGHVWRIDRDAAGRVVAVVSPEGREATLSWSAGGLAVGDAEGRLREESWDEAGRVVAVRDRAGRRERRRYEGGRLVGVEVDDLRVEAARDDGGRIVRVADSDGTRASLDRDGLGHVVRVVDGRGVAAVERDGRGRIVGATRGGEAVRIAYRPDGGVAHVERGGDVATYRRDAGLTVVTDARGERRYDGAGALVHRATDTTREAFHYGPRGELRTWETALGPAPLGALRFAYDVDGRLTGVEGTAPIPDARPLTLRFALGADGALTGVQVGGAHLRIEVDALGRPAEIRGAVAARLAFDAAGRLERVDADARAAVAYDPIDRPTHVRPGAEVEDVAANAPWQGTLAEGVGVALRLRVERRGVVLWLDADGVAAVLWVQVERRCATGTDSLARAAAILGGPTAALPALSADPAERFEALARESALRADHAAVPRAADLGRPWPLFDAFFLRPAVLAAAPAPLATTHDAADDLRGGIPGITGTHLRGALRPAPWTGAGRPPVADLLAFDGPPTLGAVLSLLA